MDGCWTHRRDIKDDVASWIGYHIEMQAYISVVFAAPILVPIGFITMRRNGLYGERRPLPS